MFQGNIKIYFGSYIFWVGMLAFLQKCQRETLQGYSMVKMLNGHVTSLMNAMDFYEAKSI